MLFTPLLPEAASGTIEPRHCVVPLRQMCPHAELVLGTAAALDEDAREVAVDTEAGSYAIGYERLVLALGSIARVLPDSGARRARARLQGPRRCDRAPQPRAAAPRGGRRGADRGRGRAPARVRLRRGRLRGRRGDRRAERPRRGHAALLPRPARRRAALGLVDAAPRILPEIPTRLGDYAARELVEARHRDPHRDDTRLGRRGRRAALERRADPGANARLDRRRPREPGARVVRPAARRARARARRRAPARESAATDVWALGDCAAVPNTSTPGTPIRRRRSTACARRAGWRRT